MIFFKQLQNEIIVTKIKYESKAIENIRVIKNYSLTPANGVLVLYDLYKRQK